MNLQQVSTNENQTITKARSGSGGAFFQPKLTVNQPNDIYEQEADAMADRVMRMPDPAINDHAFFKPAQANIQRKCQHCEEEEKLHRKELSTESVNENIDFNHASITVQRKCQHCEEEEKLHRKESSGADVNGSLGLDSYVSSLGSSGQALSESSRGFFEPRFGQDFSNVRIHTDSVAAKSAQSINALAYTTGNNIVFNSGQYSPDTDSGKRLMAHELTHVVQQGGSVGRKIQRQAAPAPTGPSPSDLSSCRIHFVQGSTEFVDANEFATCMAQIRTYLRDNPDGTVVLHGYASEEGDAAYNMDLSRRRDETVLRLLRAGRVDTRRVSTEAHGEDTHYATRPENRRVEIVMSRSISFAPETIEGTPPAPPPAFVCGPNVTTQVEDAVRQTRSRFAGWTDPQKVEACDALDGLTTGGMAWDIVEVHNNAWILGYRPACASEHATPACGSSIQVGNGCHYAGSVNYVIFGAMCKLCADHFLAHGPINTGYARFTLASMMHLIDLYKGTGFSGLATPSANFHASQVWAYAGYQGWPAVGGPAAPDRSNCATTCPTAYTGPAFRVNWYPRQYYTGSSPIIPAEDATP